MIDSTHIKANASISKTEKAKQEQSETNKQKEVARSTTDPDAGMMNCPNKPVGYHYLGHTSVDTKYGIITDVHVTAGNVNDHELYVGRLALQQQKFELDIQKVAADKGSLALH